MKLIEDHIEEIQVTELMSFQIKHRKYDPLKKKNQLDFMKIKNFCSVKDTLKENKKIIYGMGEKNHKTHIG